MPTIAIYGPTSSGKTAFSIQLGLMLAERQEMEPVVVSADSRQVYKYMDVGTSKTTTKEMRGIRHEMIDVAEPDRKLSLEQYVRLAREVISGHLSGGRLPIIVGGTGIYVASLLEGWDIAGTESARQALARDFPPSMRADAYETLRRLDKKAAAAIRPTNYDAVLNALVRATTSSGASAPAANSLVIGVDRRPDILDHRVADTFDRQLRAGLLDEIHALNERYQLDDEIRIRGSQSQNQVLNTHGYREFFELALSTGKKVEQLTKVEIGIVRGKVLDRIIPHTRRQRTWFRKLPNVRKARSAEQAFNLVVEHLGL